MDDLDHPWRWFAATAWHGKWSCGWANWKGKPQFSVCYTWYDGPHYCLHIGPLWVEVDA